MNTIACVYVEKISHTQFAALCDGFMGRADVVGYGKETNEAYNAARNDILNKLYERLVDKRL